MEASGKCQVVSGKFPGVSGSLPGPSVRLLGTGGAASGSSTEVTRADRPRLAPTTTAEPAPPAGSSADGLRRQLSAEMSDKEHFKMRSLLGGLDVPRPFSLLPR